MTVTSERRRVWVAARAWAAGLDPKATSVPSESGWHVQGTTHRGPTCHYGYDLTADQATAMAEHLETLAACFAAGDTDSRADGRACRAAADRIRKAITKGKLCS